MIQVENLAYATDGREILGGISFAAAPGGVVAVVGPNGAGKSTLVHLLAGDLEPSSGTIELDRRRISAWGRAELARRRSVMTQHAAPAFDYRVLEIVLLGRSPHCDAVEGERDLEIALAALDEVEALPLARRRVATLSGGERQRVDLARALAQIWEGDADCPSLLLLDEPTSALDLSRQHAALASARRFAGRGNAVVAVLHDLNLAAQYADRLLLLCDGRALAEGCPLEVLDPNLLREAYGLEVRVVGHPCLDCPQVLTLPPSNNLSPPSRGVS